MEDGEAFEPSLWAEHGRAHLVTIESSSMVVTSGSLSHARSSTTTPGQHHVQPLPTLLRAPKRPRNAHRPPLVHSHALAMPGVPVRAVRAPRPSAFPVRRRRGSEFEGGGRRTGRRKAPNAAVCALPSFLGSLPALPLHPRNAAGPCTIIIVDPRNDGCVLASASKRTRCRSPTPQNRAHAPCRTEHGCRR
jgi:hypothetical protein